MEKGGNEHSLPSDHTWHPHGQNQTHCLAGPSGSPRQDEPGTKAAVWGGALHPPPGPGSGPTVLSAPCVGQTQPELAGEPAPGPWEGWDPRSRSQNQQIC